PSIAFPIIFFLIIFAFGFSTAGTTLISQAKGKGDEDKINFYVGQITTLMISAAILLSLIGIVFTDPLLRILAVPEETYEYTRQYIRIVLLGLPFMFMTFILQAALHGIGNSIASLVIQIITVGLNVLLDPLLIYGIGFFPRLEVRGAAIATVIARVVSSAIAFTILLRGRKGVRLIARNMIPEKHAMRMLLKIGVPASVGQSVSALGFTVLQGVVNSFGTATIAAFGIGNRIISLFNMPAMGFSRATAVLVGQSLGAKNRKQAWQVIKLSVIIIAIFIIAGMSFMFFKGSSFVRLFVDDPEVLALGSSLFRIVSVGVVFFAMFMVLTGALQGAGDTKTVMYLNLGRLWIVRVPLAYLMGYTMNLGPNGVWYAMLISNVLVSGVGFFVVERGKWQDKINPDEI
ncbi:MAG: MATE family efflux transporter, partial [Spirochaetales bacterium]|nr:MATE family efflux transporter [Spirochaetales bacterium]